MNWRTRIARWLVKSTFANPDSWLLDWFSGGHQAAAGVSVNPNSAQQSSAVFACVQVRSQDIAKLPLILYRRTADGGRVRAKDHPLYALLATQPNSRQTSLEFREMMQAALDLRGNAYARIVRDGRYRPVQLIPLHDDWVRPLMAADGTPFYDVRMYGRGALEHLTGDDIFHLRDRSDCGFVGKSCIARARDVVGLDLAGGTYASKLYANGARPGGILIPKNGKIEKAGRDLLRDEWNETHGGVDKANSIAVMAEDMSYQPVGMTNLDAEFLGNRKLSRSEVAAIFRVPPHKVGILDNATFSNIEHQSLEYVTDTLMPIAVRWEDKLNTTLLRQSEQADYFFEFLFDGLLRGDFLSRMQGYHYQRQWGRSYNDIAKLENWPVVSKDDGGDERLVPLNMWPMGQQRPDKTAGVGTVDVPAADNAAGTQPVPSKAGALHDKPIRLVP
jgi:HK97 family phage portal protein